MGLEMLPEQLLALIQQWPCREGQLKQLTAVLSVSVLRVLIIFSSANVQ